MQRILVIKLADLGDLLTATPALRSLRATFTHAHIAALVTPQSRRVLDEAGLVDEVHPFPKQHFDRLSAVVRPGGAAALARLMAWLRAGRFDAALLMHHLTTPAGRAKYWALLAATGAPIRAGLDNGYGNFLTHRAPDYGFGARHEVEYCNDVAGLLGAPPDYGRPTFVLTEADRAEAAALLPATTERQLVAIHPGAGWYSLARRWPADRFNSVAAELDRAGMQVVVVGGPDEREIGAQVAAAARGAIDLTGRTTLGGLAALLERCRLFIGSDSGVGHLAAAAGTPVISIFGPSNDAAWRPWGGPDGQVTVIRSGLPCQPCFYRGHALGTPEGCPARTCLQLVTAEQVVAEALAQLKGPAQPTR